MLKHIFKYIGAIALCLIIFNSSAQAQNIAFVDVQSVVPEMSTYKSAQASLEAYVKQLDSRFMKKQQEAQSFYTETMKDVDALPPVELQEREAKLMKMQEDLQKMQQGAPQKVAQKEQELLKPVHDQFNKVVAEVAKENGYDYIADKQLFLATQGGIDVTSKVKAKLGM